MRATGTGPSGWTGDRREARRGRVPRLRPAGGARRHGARHGLVLPRDGGARPRRLVRPRDRLRQQRPRREDDRAWGTEEQRAEWLPRAGRGSALGCYALTEPGAGSDPSSLVTRAERDGDGWVLNGSKIFITLGSWAGVALVFARSGGEGPRDHVLPRPDRAEGFRPRRSTGSSGCARRTRRSSSSTASGSPTRPCSATRASGFKVAMSALDNGRISLAAGSVGIAQGCVDASIAYAAERRQFGQPIAAFQLVQELIADMAVETEAARLLTWRAASLADAGEPYTLAASQAKYYASEAAVRRRERGGAGARRLRLRRRVPGAEVPARRARLDALRRHEPDPEAR